MQLINPFSRPQAGLTHILVERDSLVLAAMASHFKDRSKSLHRALTVDHPHLKLMQVQEAIAKSSGFTNTHALQCTLATLTEGIRDVPLSERARWLKAHSTTLDRIAPVYQLHAIEGYFVPTRYKMAYLDRLSWSMSRHLGIQHPFKLLDAMARAWVHVDDWSSLANYPLGVKKHEDYCYFWVDERPPEGSRPQGQFVLHAWASNVLSWLWPMNPSQEDTVDLKEALELAQAFTQQHPELVQGWAQASHIAEQLSKSEGAYWGQALKLMKDGLQTAKKLMPKGFNGELNPYAPGNKVFLACLWHFAVLWLKSEHGVRNAYRTVGEYLRFNPTDANALVQYPILVARCSSSSATIKKVMRQALALDDAAGLVNVGITKLWLGQAAGFQHLIEGVLRNPSLGAHLVCDRSVWPLPDVEPPVQYAAPNELLFAAFTLLEDYEDFERMMDSVLTDPPVLAEKRRLNEVLKTGDWTAWKKDVAITAANLASSLASKHTLVDHSEKH